MLCDWLVVFSAGAFGGGVEYATGTVFVIKATMLASLCSRWQLGWLLGGRCTAVQWIGSEKAVVRTM